MTVNTPSSISLNWVCKSSFKNYSLLFFLVNNN